MPDPALDYTTGTITWKAIAGQDAIHYVQQSGGATGGNYTLNYEHPAVSVGTIAYNANIAVIQTAFDAAFGANETVVSGVDATSFSVEFSGATYGLTQIIYQSLTNALTGGSSPTVTVTETQVGRPDQTAPLFDFQGVDGLPVFSMTPQGTAVIGNDTTTFRRTSPTTDSSVVMARCTWFLEADSTLRESGCRVDWVKDGGGGANWLMDTYGNPDGTGANASLTFSSTAMTASTPFDFEWTDNTTSTFTLKAVSGQAAPLLDLQTGYVQVSNISDPAAPADNSARVYVRNNGGKDELVVRFATGAIQRLAIEP